LIGVKIAAYMWFREIRKVETHSAGKDPNSGHQN
jgi:hypothetical protein